MDVHLNLLYQDASSSVLKVASIPTFLKVGRGLPPLDHKDTMKGFPLLWYGESKRAKQNASFWSGAWARCL